MVRTLTEHGGQPVLTAVRGPQGSLAERVNRELGRLFHVYSHEWHNSWLQCIQFFKQSMNGDYNTVTSYTLTELDSEKQPSRFRDSHIKHVNTVTLPVPI